MLITMKDLLAVAQQHNFAVPAFNTSSSMILKGVMEACSEKRAPVIIAIHPDELSFTGQSFVAMVKEEAHRASVPVCIHLDHGATLDQVVQAISCGFTSVMIDASSMSFEDNIAITRQVVQVAHAANVSVEAELGTIGAVDDKGESGANEIIYTNPHDVETFVRETGVDTLAIAIGTSHGLYPSDKKPQLRLDLLDEIVKLTDIPLVLHGGSDNPDHEIAQAVRQGVCKINISSDTKKAFYVACREVLKDPAIREPNAVYPPCIEAMKTVVYQKIDLFNTADKAHLYCVR
ncbi:MAG: ketose-bisphosphate aldolase [Spirochaetales bacterium]|nr:ketose-bisphosphate aldolase [Spirochaetales bacterium]